MSITGFFAAVAICNTLPFAIVAQSDTMPQHHHVGATAVDGNPSHIVSGLSIPDVELVNQRGQTVHFYSGLVKGKVVAINTIFTTCTTICPVMGANFTKLSKLLALEDRGRVNLISISIDPVLDTPEHLDRWSRAFRPGETNWTLLTGTKSNVDAVLRALQVFTPDKLNHQPVVLIGGDGTGDWVRASALQSAATLVDLIHSRLAIAKDHLPREF